jgi:hypothetical protein
MDAAGIFLKRTVMLAMMGGKPIIRIRPGMDSATTIIHRFECPDKKPLTGYSRNHRPAYDDKCGRGSGKKETGKTDKHLMLDAVC